MGGGPRGSMSDCRRSATVKPPLEVSPELRQALAGQVIDQSQAAKAAARSELVGNKIHRPALLGLIRQRPRPTSRSRELSAQLASQAKPLLTIEPLGALVVFDQPLGLEDVVQERRAPARLERSPVTQARPQSRVVANRGGVWKTGTVPAGGGGRRGEWSAQSER